MKRSHAGRSRQLLDCMNKKDYTEEEIYGIMDIRGKENIIKKVYDLGAWEPGSLGALGSKNSRTQEPKKP